MKIRMFEVSALWLPGELFGFGGFLTLGIQTLGERSGKMWSPPIGTLSVPFGAYLMGSGNKGELQWSLWVKSGVGLGICGLHSCGVV